MTILNWPGRERAAEQQNHKSVESKRVKIISEACADQERYRFFDKLLTKGVRTIFRFNKGCTSLHKQVLERAGT